MINEDLVYDSELKIQRSVVGFSKTPDPDGEYLAEVEFKLPDMKLRYYQVLFNIDPNEPNDIIRHIIDPLDINSMQAKELQKHLAKGEVIDTDKYDFEFHAWRLEE